MKFARNINVVPAENSKCKEMHPCALNVVSGVQCSKFAAMVAGSHSLCQLSLGLPGLIKRSLFVVNHKDYFTELTLSLFKVQLHVFDILKLQNKYFLHILGLYFACIAVQCRFQCTR